MLSDCLGVLADVQELLAHLVPRSSEAATHAQEERIRPTSVAGNCARSFRRDND